MSTPSNISASITNPTSAIADALSTAWNRACTWTQQHLVLLMVLAVLAVACFAVVERLRRAARRRWYARARVVTVLPPAGIDPAAAVAGARRLWWDLPSLAPPRWKRLFTAVPHLALEYHLAAGMDLTVRVWLPGPVPTSRIDAALRAAWPGTLVLDHTPTTPRSGQSGEAAHASTTRLVVTGGSVRPERPEHLPLRVPESRDESADPLRALEAVTGQLAEGESAVVQILARPAVGRRLRRYRRTVDRLHSGRPERRSALASFVSVLVREVMEIVTGSNSTAATSDHTPRRLDPQQTEELREIRAKKQQPQWEVALRYYAATTAHGPQAADRVRGIADSLFGAFALLAGRNALARHRLPKPRAVVAARRLRRGALLSAGELAALAHLPARTDALASGQARSVPAPAHTTRRL
ncbi:hypothetical protein [Amycolatopsis pithecellobii]|uniref:Uncharacterized protein n=1 Tax=Amycolatopsis pithecellobii TaxID=664692 RepID=A0A6N7YYJ2_9PSEU|nr:hypothetical protein [Amycolatopsis pithecellobii]MTD58157.1 hypothetical protein [Amycolatopsis pithecellobii]